MDTMLLIAKVLGAYFIVSGIFLITHKKTFVNIMNDFFKNRALSFVVGAMLVMGGALIVFTAADSGDSGITTFVNLMGWAILIKGAIYILAPESLHRMVKPWSRYTLTLLGATVAAIGAYLVFFLG